MQPSVQLHSERCFHRVMACGDLHQASTIQKNASVDIQNDERERSAKLRDEGQERERERERMEGREE